MSQPPLIIHTEASTGDGGQEARILTELNYLRARGYRVALVAPRDGTLFERAKVAGLPVYAVPFAKLTQPLDFLRLILLFLFLRPYAVCTHSSIDSWVALSAAALLGIKRRLRYRHVSVPPVSTLANRFLYHRLATEVITTGDCISLPLHDVLGVPLARLHTIPTGIRSPEELPSREEARAALQAELSLPADAHFVGMVAVMRSWKGHRVLFDSFAKIAAEFPELHLVLVGGGVSLENIRSSAAGNPFSSRIHFVGQQKDVWRYFRALDVAVLASTKNEGIPQSLLQAMFCSTPVVGTNVGGIPEIVGHGVTGLLCEGGSPESLAIALLETLREPLAAAARAQTALEMVRRQHTVAFMGAQIEKILTLEPPRLLLPRAIPVAKT